MFLTAIQTDALVNMCFHGLRVSTLVFAFDLILRNHINMKFYNKTSLRDFGFYTLLDKLSTKYFLYF